MNIYVYCDVPKKKVDGSIPVKIAIKNSNGRFFVNTGLTTMEKFTGREFPKTERNRTAKNSALARYMVAIEEVCLSNSELDNKKLRELINKSVFGVDKSEKEFIQHFIEKYADGLKKRGTKDIYYRTAKRVENYDSKATFDTIDKEWIEGYKRFYDGTLKTNTIAIDLRNIRTIFNKAIDDEITTKYPFRKLKIEQERVPIRDLTAEQIAQLRDYDVEPWQEEYRDLFMLSFYLCGINASDLLMCKTLTNGRLVYKRNKTGRLYSIKVEKEAMDIINKYRGKEYLLNPLDNGRRYTTYLYNWNSALKKIGRHEIVKDCVGKLRKKKCHPIFGDDFQISTYTARYSFASIAAHIGIDRETIALCLGHSWADVTDHYINYDRNRIDEAVRKVIDYVNAL
jgi:hypothetical protein